MLARLGFLLCTNTKAALEELQRGEGKQQTLLQRSGHGTAWPTMSHWGGGIIAPGDSEPTAGGEPFGRAHCSRSPGSKSGQTG